MSRPTQQFAKGQTILQEGTLGDRSFKIMTGEVLVCKKNKEADWVPIAKLGPGEIFGEMYLFDRNKARTASVIATSEVLVEVFYQDEFQRQLNHLSPSLVSMLHGFSRRLQVTSMNCANAYRGQSKMTRLPDGSLREGGTNLGR